MANLAAQRLSLGEKEYSMTEGTLDDLQDLSIEALRPRTRAFLTNRLSFFMEKRRLGTL